MKTILSFLFISIFFIAYSTPTIPMEGSCGKDCRWEMNEKNHQLSIIGNGKMDDFYADDEIPWKDHLGSIQSISLNDGILSVGQKAFQNTKSLREIVWGNDVKIIKKGAFYNSGIVELTIPKSVETIEKSAFEENKMMTSINFQSEESNLKEIQMRAFKNCFSLTSVIIPDSVQIVGAKAFEGCQKMQTIIFGSSVSEIGQHALMKCKSLKTITVKEENVNFKHDEEKIAIIDKITKALIHFAVSSEKKEYVIPEDIEIIGKEAFVENALESIIFPQSLLEIEESAFYGSRHLIQATFQQYLK